jgi:hypothetical protein
MAAAIRRFNSLLLSVLDTDERMTAARLAISVVLIIALFGGWVPLGGKGANGFQLLTALGKWAQGDLITAAFFMLFGMGLVLAMSAAMGLLLRKFAPGNRGNAFYFGLGTVLFLALWLLLWNGTRTMLGLVAPGFCLIVALANFLLILNTAKPVRRFLDAALLLAGFCILALALWVFTGTGGQGGSGPGFWLAVLGLLACGIVEYAAYLQDAYLPSPR